MVGYIVPMTEGADVEVLDDMTGRWSHGYLLWQCAAGWCVEITASGARGNFDNDHIRINPAGARYQTGA